MESEKTLKEEIVDAVHGELLLFKGELWGQFENINGRFEKIDARFDAVDRRFNKVDERFNKIDGEIAKLGVAMEMMDDKFLLITEGQDMLREILETRVARIEEGLGIESRI
jgi:predicted nuclease with TOPRIM domain